LKAISGADIELDSNCGVYRNRNILKFSSI